MPHRILIDLLGFYSSAAFSFKNTSRKPLKLKSYDA